MTRSTSLVLIISLCSCKAYQQDILFKLDKNFTKSDLAEATTEIESNYILKSNDVLLLDVFTNKGEILIDSNFELIQQGNTQGQQRRDPFQYVIQSDGTVTFPLVGSFKIAGMTLFEAELKVAEKFDEVYKKPFVKLRVNNRRVFVLGAPGGKVIPLPNENTNLIEVLAGVEGLELGAKAQNIKLIRGELVYQINLSTISGMRKTNMNVEPSDVIYVEPWRRPWLETLKDVSPVLSLIYSALTLIVVVQTR